jgi:KDO2-lipid IV(A) lauroyltransferase
MDHDKVLDMASRRKKKKKTGRLWDRALHRAAVVMLRVAWVLSSMLPPDAAAALGRSLGRIVGPRLHRNRRIVKNFTAIFPDRSADQIAALARAAWGTLGATIFEYPHLERLLDDPERVEVVDRERLACWRGGRGAVFVTGHIANWEVCVATSAAQGVPVSIVYSPLDNPYIDRAINDWRRRFGVTPIPKEGATLRLARTLKAGKSIGLLVDQRVEGGIKVPFFGKSAVTSDTPARLALRFGCDLVPVQVERRGGCRFRVTFHAPVRPTDPDATVDEQARDMTAQINLHLESWIRTDPDAWVCPKRRFRAGDEPV